MSHISSLSVRITDTDALARACQELGVELRREQHTFRTFGGQRNPCAMAIVDPQNAKAYELGLVATKDGGYEIQVDHWGGGGGLYSKLGEQFGSLLQHYGICAAEGQASREGHNHWRQTLPDGSIRLFCEPKQQFAQQAAGGGWGGGF